MAKIKLEINPESAIRLKKLCSDRHITQRKLSEITNISQNTISQIAQGKRALSRPLATIIAEAFPPTRPEWLIGADDFETPLEAELVPRFLRWQDTARRSAAAGALFETLGITFELNFSEAELRDLFPDFEWELTGKDAIKATAGRPDILQHIMETNQGSAAYRIISNGEVVGTCSVEKRNQLLKQVSAFAVFSFEELLGGFDNGM